MTHLDNTAGTALSRRQNDSDAEDVSPWHLPCYSIPAPRQRPRCEQRWACVYTHPQAERWANDNLTRTGYQTYLPLYLVSRPDRATPSILHRVLVPLWSRYLFIQFDHLTESWTPIRDTPGVCDLVRCGSDVHYATAGTVEALQATEDARRSPIPETGRWAPGTPCSLGKGYVMGGLPAVVLDSSRNRVKIGIMFLGDIRIVSVPPECLVKRDVPE